MMIIVVASKYGAGWRDIPKSHSDDDDNDDGDGEDDDDGDDDDGDDDDSCRFQIWGGEISLKATWQ